MLNFCLSLNSSSGNQKLKTSIFLLQKKEKSVKIIVANQLTKRAKLRVYQNQCFANVYISYGI